MHLPHYSYSNSRKSTPKCKNSRFFSYDKHNYRTNLTKLKLKRGKKSREDNFLLLSKRKITILFCLFLKWIWYRTRSLLIWQLIIFFVCLKILFVCNDARAYVSHFRYRIFFRKEMIYGFYCITFGGNHFYIFKKRWICRFLYSIAFFVEGRVVYSKVYFA